MIISRRISTLGEPTFTHASASMTAALSKWKVDFQHDIGADYWNGRWLTGMN
jgi:hypothetical protein